MIAKKYVIGITGNTGSGKSTVADTLGDQGVDVIDADKLAHKFMTPGHKCYTEIVREFGNEILDYENAQTGDPNNASPAPPIDRKKLAGIVFNDKKKRDLLEGLVHPWVIRECIELIKNSSCDVVAVDAVLLVESGLHKICDTVWIVRASDNVRLQRIMERDDITIEEAELRMKNQRDIHEEKIDHTTRTIYNDNSKEFLQNRVITYLEEEKGGKV